MTNGVLSCSEFSFPALPFDSRLELVRLLGFTAVDLGLFLDTPAQAAELVAAPSATSQRLARSLKIAELEPADLFLIVGGDDFESGALTSPRPQHRAELRGVFGAALECATDLGLKGMSIMPGLAWADNSRAGWQVAVDELKWRVERAAAAGLELWVEPHIASLVPTPELVAALLADVPGLRLTLDPGHFEFQAIKLERVLPLAGHAGHVHISGASAGALHVPWRSSTWDLAVFLSELHDAGFSGRYCVEYVPMQKWGAGGTDVLGAIVATRTAITDFLELGSP